MVDLAPFVNRSIGLMVYSRADKPMHGEDYFRNEPVINDWIEADGRSSDQPFDGAAEAEAERLI
jgi:hypothetical protein